jgi:hypothetical protein
MQVLRDNLEGRANRWALLAAFADQFLRPFTAADSVSAQEMIAIAKRLPRALTEFYSLCGNAADIWCRQDEWLRPSALREINGVLVFWVENQGNWRIGVRTSELVLDDPPVVWDGVWARGEYTVLTESVTKFALNMIAYVAKCFDQSFERAYGYAFEIEQFVHLLGSVYSTCQLQREWVYGPEWYFEDAETFVEVNAGDGYVYPIFKTPAAVNRFCSLIDQVRFQWETPPIQS